MSSNNLNLSKLSIINSKNTKNTKPIASRKRSLQNSLKNNQSSNGEKQTRVKKSPTVNQKLDALSVFMNNLRVQPKRTKRQMTPLKTLKMSPPKRYSAKAKNITLKNFDSLVKKSKNSVIPLKSEVVKKSKSSLIPIKSKVVKKSTKSKVSKAQKPRSLDQNYKLAKLFKNVVFPALKLKGKAPSKKQQAVYNKYFGLNNINVNKLIL